MSKFYYSLLILSFHQLILFLHSLSVFFWNIPSPLSYLTDLAIISLPLLWFDSVHPSLLLQPIIVLLQRVTLQSPELINLRLLHFIFPGIFGPGTQEVCSPAGGRAIRCSVLHSWWDPLSSVLQSSETHSDIHTVSLSTSRSWSGVSGFLHVMITSIENGFWICSALWLQKFGCHQDPVHSGEGWVEPHRKWAG